MAKNKLIDLNNHLFLALERLNEEDLTKEQLELEAKRSESIIGISKQIINNAKTNLAAMKLISEGDIDSDRIPESFGFKKLEGSSNGG